MKDYSFRSAIPGEVSKICNEAAAEGFEVEQLYKEGPKFWILMSRDPVTPVPVVKKTAPKKPAAKKVEKAAAPSIEEESATKE